MISLMHEFDARLSVGMKNRRDFLATGIVGAAVLAARPLLAMDVSDDPNSRLREIFQTYGGEFGPARKGA
jgi:hypothetical protein